MLNKFLMLSFLAVLSVGASERVYIDDDDLSVKSDSFYVHLGNNVWINTSSLYRDETGLFTYECSINGFPKKNQLGFGYEKTWKCPYCYNYWPIGKPCGNKDCPSRYRN